jgi:DNA-binding NarL/FixJ family response regulator
VKCILIVDDNLAVRRSLRALLECNSDWKVGGEAANGYDAIAKAQELHPDLIVLDMCLPVMNGLDAAKELKKQTPHVPLLMFTGSDTFQLEKMAMNSGFSSVTPKVDAPALVNSIRRLLRTPAA